MHRISNFQSSASKPHQSAPKMTKQHPKEHHHKVRSYLETVNHTTSIDTLISANPLSFKTKFYSSSLSLRTCLPRSSNLTTRLASASLSWLRSQTNSSNTVNQARYYGLILRVLAPRSIRLRT